MLDENNAPLPGITVTIKDTDRGTATNSSGKFYFNDVSHNTTIMFQGVGFPSQEMQAQKIMNVKLVQQISNLDEVQVIAYGISVKALSGFNTETGKYNWRSIYSRISSHHKID